jgi:2-phosphoglycolate phosphatase
MCPSTTWPASSSTERFPTRTVLFDLDGTLLDTAPDLADALNAVLIEHGRSPIPFEQIRGVASHGAMALIRVGFAMEESHPDFQPLRRRLLDLYRDNIARKSRPFPGMNALLDQLERRGYAWGVVTNKPGWLTDPLLKALGLYDRAACVVSGDTLETRKPHPAPMLHACALTDSRPEDCVYVGDAERDVEAGKNAGMHSLVALFGYFQAHDRPQDWPADDMIHSPTELLDWLDRINGPQ